MNTRRYAIAAVVILSTLATARAHAEDATASPGDDLAAATGSLRAGDTLTLEAGDYELSQPLSLDLDGDTGAPIRIEGAEDGDVVLTLTGTGSVIEATGDNFALAGLELTGGSAGVTLTDVTAVELDGLSVHDVDGPGIACQGGTECVNVVVDGVEVAATDTGMLLGCADGSCALTDSTVRNCLVHAFHDGGDDGIVLSSGSSGNTIADDVVFGAPGDGIRVSGFPSGLDNQIVRNFVAEAGGSAIRVAGRVVISDNVVLRPGTDGIHSETDGAFTPGHISILHNTVFSPDDVRCFAAIEWSIETEQYVANNVFFCPTGKAMEVADGAPNAILLANYTLGSVFGGGDYVQADDATIELVDPLEGDLYPTTDSSLIDVGDPEYTTAVDFNGDPREATNPDVGAYEVTAADNPGWPLQDGFKGATNGGGGTNNGTTGTNNATDGGGGQHSGASGGGGGAGDLPVDHGGCCATLTERSSTPPLLVFLGICLVGLLRRRRA